KKFKKRSKKALTLSSILLTVMYFILIVPAKAIKNALGAIKNFSLKEIINSITPRKVMQNFVVPVTAVALLVLTIGYWTNYIDFGLSVQCGGETFASVSDTGVIQQAREITNDKLSEDVDANFTPVYQVKMMGVEETSATANQVSNAMVSTDTSLSNNSAGLYINGKFIGACDSYDELNSSLEELLKDDKEYYDEESEIGFYNNVEVKEGIFNNSDLKSVDEIIKTAKSKKLLQVLVKTDVVLTEKTPYDTKVKYDKKQDSSYKKVTKKGVCGKQKTTYRISLIDGVQVDAVITDVKTIKKPVTKVVTKGKGSDTSEVYTSEVSSAGFIWPVPSVHTISSPYGYREGGEFHTGIDIADGDCYGATIVASKGGTVEWAGYDDSGYGNYVIINHGDGYKTLYGHCSAVYVSQGQQVSQGQSICAIGSTGQSFGNHLHFEVRTGDQRSDRQNPLNYVSN
ncbi:MAG: peptidoglycan DD-metalloendopeptidase family protein, partial [Oscillospiraceae bacterium]|nr:peptidoglycan DD-metalloendopeptidase family protein [Oscillospiraceae bacterium]